MIVRIFVVVYSWVDPINTLCSSAHHDCQHNEGDPVDVARVGWNSDWTMDIRVDEFKEVS